MSVVHTYVKNNQTSSMSSWSYLSGISSSTVRIEKGYHLLESVSSFLPSSMAFLNMQFVLPISPVQTTLMPAKMIKIATKAKIIVENLGCVISLLLFH